MTIYAYCDSLSEPNPGQMEGGIWAKDDKENVLFMENVRMGHGTCNQAEYYALIHLLKKLRTVVKQPVKIVIHSDSQLMTKQLNGLWKVTKADIKALYKKVMAMRETLPFEVRWIPRENNAIADALAQENRLKGSGRQAMMEDGRFRVKKHTPCVELLADKEMSRLLRNPQLIELKEQVEGELQKQTIDYRRILNQLQGMKKESKAASEKIPHINNLADKWVRATLDHLDSHLDDLIGLARKRSSHLVDSFHDYFGSSYPIPSEPHLPTLTHSDTIKDAFDYEDQFEASDF
jgi:ribonuclease HI